MDIQIIDNYLEQQYFDEIANTFVSDSFPWFIGKGVSNDHDGQRQFFHYLYRDSAPNSNYFALLHPMLDKMNIASVIRMKANLVPKTNKIIKHDFHRDQNFKCKIAVFYFNTNNGYTHFKNGKTVKSVANRMAIFDSDLWHGGTTCSDAHERIVLNINYIEKVAIKRTEQ